MEPCTIPQSMTHLDVIQAHVRRLPRTSYARLKNLPYALLFSGLAAAWGGWEIGAYKGIAKLNGIYIGGCFFFRRGTPGCNVKDHLFSTLAYQLATNVHDMLEHVDWAMAQEFSLPKRSVTVQLKRLIIEPIQVLPTPVRPTIIIIDECEDSNSQRDILTLIGQVTMDPNVAIRFIVASRLEHQICDLFNKQPLFSSTRRLVLDGDRHRYRNPRGYKPRVSGGTGTGTRICTPTIPVPVRRV